ncbi:hypothetical protein AMJ49_03700 [Parcubacteria bacterium DG_74_2]|nr:MAG: hypothetical protein AMJ49_03700 [Parcubacteria bacterium DG_74_2]
MIPLVFYNIFILFFCVLVGLLTVRIIFKKARKDKESISFAWYLFLILAVFALDGLRLLFSHLGYSQIDRILFYGLFVVAPIAMAPCLYHLVLKIGFQEKLAKITGLAGSLMMLGVFLLMLKDVIKGPIITDWGNQYSLLGVGGIVLNTGFLGKYVIIMYDLVARIGNWIKNKRIIDSYKWFTSLTIFLICCILAIETTGLFAAGWQLLLFRILFLIAVLINYLSYTSEEVMTKFQKL